MKIKEFFIEFFLIFIISAIITSLMTFTHNLFLNPEEDVNYIYGIQFGLILGIVIPLHNYFSNRRKQ